MRIEISTGVMSGAAAISEYQSCISDLISSTESMISCFKTIKKETSALNGGIGSLTDALDELDSRIMAEEQKKEDMVGIQNKSNDFLELATRVDREVASLVNRNKDEFYRVNPWLKPPVTNTIQNLWNSRIWEFLTGKPFSFVTEAPSLLRPFDHIDWTQLVQKSILLAGIPLMGVLRAGSASGVTDDPSDSSGFLDSLLNKSASGSVVFGEVSGKTEVGGISVAGSADGSLLYGEAKVKNKTSWKYKDKDGNWNFDSFGTSIEAKATGAVAQGKVEGNIGYAHGSLEGSALTGSVSGEAKATLWDDGKFNPSLSLGAKAEASALQGEAEIGFGDDQYGVYAKADGDLLHAKAEAKAGVGYIGKDKDGKSQYGVSAEASAMASAAEGKVRGGFTLFGVDIDVGLKGYAGAVGVEAGGSISTSSVKAKFGGSLLLGGALDVSIDWSDAEWIDDTADFVEDAGKAVWNGAVAGVGFIEDAGKAVWNGITEGADYFADALFGWL